MPKRYGLNFNPPMIILEYMVKSLGKLYLKKMKLFKLKATTQTDIALKYLKIRYPEFFGTGKIGDAQLCKLIDKLKAFLESGFNLAKKNNSQVLVAQGNSAQPNSQADTKPAAKQDRQESDGQKSKLGSLIEQRGRAETMAFEQRHRDDDSDEFDQSQKEARQPRPSSGLRRAEEPVKREAMKAESEESKAGNEYMEEEGDDFDDFDEIEEDEEIDEE